MREPNAFTWGTRDRFGQEFGVAWTRHESKVAAAARKSRKTPEGRRKASLAGARAWAKKKPVTKVKLKCLGDE